MIVRQIRMSSQAKERLSRLKGKTGIDNWNVLCRWALCYSLAEDTIPTDVPVNTDSNLEMSWMTFAGEYYEIYEAVMKVWCRKKGLASDQKTTAKYFRLHLDRGIAYLSGTGLIKTIDDLLMLTEEKKT